MMTIPRSQQIDLNITPYYHCVSRCVRRSFLCGEDKLTGRSYAHRRQWLEDRILTLAQIYCIDLCAYAVMSNHYHIVVHINRPKALQLSSFEVIERWATEHQLPLLIQRYLHNQVTTSAEIKTCEALIQRWRERLSSLSWFMRELNVEIARQANQEDQCTGHFWEGRFKSQALLDEKALLAAMAYVDLNPIRANVEVTPETSRHTSIKRRIGALAHDQPTPHGLFPFIGYEHQDKTAGIPFRLMDYIELVDWVGRHLTPEKRGNIPSKHPEILTHLSIQQMECLKLCTELERGQYLWVGSSTNLHKAKQMMNKQRMHGISI